MKPAREPASSRPKPCLCIPDKAPRIVPVRCSLLALVGCFSIAKWVQLVPPRVAPPIWCSLTGSSPPFRFPWRYASFGAMTVGTNTVWLVDSTDSATPTTSDMPLAGHSVPGLLAISLLPRYGSTPAGRQRGKGRV